VIGQSLEVAKIPTFELGADGLSYVVKCDSLTQAGEWVLRHALSRNDFSEQTTQSKINRFVRFSPSDISRLDGQAQPQRYRNSSLPEECGRLSQLLRTLGYQLDPMMVSAFKITSSSASVSVDFQLPDGQRDSRTFTFDKLRQLGSSSRFLRSKPDRLNSDLRNLPKSTKPRNR